MMICTERTMTDNLIRCNASSPKSTWTHSVPERETGTVCLPRDERKGMVHEM